MACQHRFSDHELWTELFEPVEIAGHVDHRHVGGNIGHGSAAGFGRGLGITVEGVPDRREGDVLWRALARRQDVFVEDRLASRGLVIVAADLPCVGPRHGEVILPADALQELADLGRVAHLLAADDDRIDHDETRCQLRVAFDRRSAMTRGGRSNARRRAAQGCRSGAVRLLPRFENELYGYACNGARDCERDGCALVSGIRPIEPCGRVPGQPGLHPRRSFRLCEHASR